MARLTTLYLLMAGVPQDAESIIAAYPSEEEAREAIGYIFDLPKPVNIVPILLMEKGGE